MSGRHDTDRADRQEEFDEHALVEGLFDQDDDDDEPATPADPRLVWMICSTCNGEGTRVNPNIDGNGLTREDFEEDPDFHEAYMDGRYDIACSACNGTGKVREIPFSALTPAEIKAIDDDARDDASEAWLRRAESGERW